MQQATFPFESVDMSNVNASPGDEKKLISRLILQRIMTSSSAQYLDKVTYEKLTKYFLSESPDDTIELTYRDKDSHKSSYSYYGNICSLSVSWLESANCFNDLEGNVWGSYNLRVLCNVQTSKMLEIKEFMERAECVSDVAALAADLTTMVPGPIRFMKMTNAQRIEKEAKEKYDETCNLLHSLLVYGTARDVRKGLRSGGNSRGFDRDLVKGVKPGVYCIVVNDGSRRSPRNREYWVTIPERESFRPHIRRTK